MQKDDPVTDAIATLVAEYAVLHPTYVLPSIFGKMDSDSEVVRQNAVNVLSQVFKVSKDILANDTAPQFQKLSETLTTCLMKRLHDDNIYIRNQTSAIFAFTNPNQIVPKLCRQLTHRDARVRSTAEKSLVEVLLSPKYHSEASVVLLDCIRNLSTGTAQYESSPKPVPKSPADILSGKPAQSHKDDMKASNEANIERILRVAKKWAEAVDTRLWADIVPTLLSKMYAAPNDSAIVRFVNVVAPSWGPKEVAIVASWSLDVMRRQPKPENESLNAEDVQNILFSRLCPLLALKVFIFKSVNSLLLSGLDFLTLCRWSLYQVWRNFMKDIILKDWYLWSCWRLCAKGLNHRQSLILS
ncbi:hypothetical protein BC829DRAFT_400384 [Chytridium lagenaria]|nr:hypothetical protein BC829DRAFT_400384 [Chytridium lagenaria]